MITVSAWLSMNAASSALPVFTARCAWAPAAAVAVSPPKPPRMTLKNERFIALHMMYERIAPELPTRLPATMSMALLRLKPMPAAAQPE